MTGNWCGCLCFLLFEIPSISCHEIYSPSKKVNVTLCTQVPSLSHTSWCSSCVGSQPCWWSWPSGSIHAGDPSKPWPRYVHFLKVLVSKFTTLCQYLNWAVVVCTDDYHESQKRLIVYIPADWSNVLLFQFIVSTLDCDSFLISGAGVGTVVISFLLCTYYNVIIAWAIYYFVQSFHSELPWTNCNATWAVNCFDDFGPNVTAPNGSKSGPEEFFK